MKFILRRINIKKMILWDYLAENLNYVKSILTLVFIEMQMELIIEERVTALMYLNIKKAVLFLLKPKKIINEKIYHSK